MNAILDFIKSSRVKSFLWRSGMMILASIISIILNNLNILQISPTFTTLLGLFLGEVSKAINNKLSETV